MYKIKINNQNIEVGDLFNDYTFEQILEVALELSEGFEVKELIITKE